MPKKNDFAESITVDEEKLKLIKFYCAEKGETVDIEKDISELVQKYIDRLYNRKVPKVVRHYLANKDRINNPAEAVKPKVENVVPAESTEKIESEVTENEFERK
jgi:hypothetical protein